MSVKFKLIPLMDCSKAGLYFLFLFAILTFSCKQKTIEFVDGSLDNAFAVATKEAKSLMVVAYMPGCESCQGYIDALNNDRMAKNALAEDYIIYKCPLNQIGNEYIAQSSYNIASPTCYVFDRDGKLIQAIVGNKGIKHLITSTINAQDSIDSHSNSFRIGLNGREYIDFVNTMLDTRKLLLDNSADTMQLETSLRTLRPTLFQTPFFYNHYLTAKLSDKLGHKEEAALHAKKALSYDDDFSVFLYGELRKEMKFLTGEGGTDASAYLSFEKTSINLGSTPLKSRPRALFAFKNTGKVPLIIKNVKGNCNCMNITWSEKPVLPGLSDTIGVTYKGDHEGAYSKVLLVTSNAANEQEKITLTGIIN